MRLKEKLQISPFNNFSLLFFDALRCAALIFSGMLFFGSPLQAEEAILNYHTLIEVQKDSELIITEKITVRAEGSKIRRGIFRDFPTDYRNQLGHRYIVGFEILDVERDRYKEKYHTEKRDNGVRIYIGNANVTLPTGEYTYTIKYKTNRQLGFFENHDELYYNAIGHGWEFPIRAAQVDISLPQELKKNSIQLDGYSGPQGATNKDFTVYKDPNYNFITYKLTKPLRQFEGLTVVVGFEKGVVKEPSGLQKWRYFFRDNFDIFIGVLGFAAALLYYLVAWHYVGRDPSKGSIFPQWEIPSGMNPADIRFLKQMSYDKKAFTSMIVGMAIKGLLEIEHSDLVNRYVLRNRSKNKEADETEKAVLQALFYGGDTLAVEQDNHSEIRAGLDTLHDALKDKHHKKTFYSNLEFVFPAVIIMCITFFLEWQFAGGKRNNLFSAGIFMILFAFMALHLYFRYLLKAPTIAGRKMLDRIEGLKMYLTMAEKDSMNRVKSLEEVPILYEKFLPYAMALGVESEWAEKFEKQFNLLEEQGHAYRPSWYRSISDDRRGFNLGSFSSGFSSGFTSSIASSSTPPGSSSGFSGGGGGGGGGGSSGGGGGGGGGGGW